MASSGSLWHRLSESAGAILDLPPLELVVPARPEVMQGLLQHHLSWIVGPPKIGKTVLAYYTAYLHSLDRVSVGELQCVASFDGAAECARAVDLVLEAPYGKDIRVAIFENPFGSNRSQPNTIFLQQLRHLAETRSDLRIIATTRSNSYLRYEDDIRRAAHYCTPLTMSDWYSTEALVRYSRLKQGSPLASELISRLASPALIDDYIRHNVLPVTEKDREALRSRFGRGIEDVTLDKLAAFQERPKIGILAVMVRLQELAPILPSAQEICRLVGIDPLTERHLGLVATTYEFDGSTRLRFEHATTREAADIFLRAHAQDEFRRLAELPTIQSDTSWVGRAIELWRAQQDIHQGDWETLRGKPEDVLLAVCTDMLALAQEPDAAVDLIGELDYDAWTVQDLAYEIAARWPQHQQSAGVRTLVRRILDSSGVDGVYAVLEALLYIRSEEVRSLWDEVDAALITLARGSGEVPRQLLLAVDGLAWRPPPAWHQLGAWCRLLIDRLSPGSDAWGFIRFMMGYHPEGVAYLRDHITGKVDELVTEDRTVVWSAGQAAVAAWLVQWHFVHQCRARAQLARQPWVDQQFLCRSFHRAIPNQQHDREAARLIESLVAGYIEEPGWGFFLSENIRAVSPTSYGDRSRLAGERSLAAAKPGDRGVLAAVLTYAVDPLLLSQIRAYFEDRTALSTLLETLVEGLMVQGIRLIEPRFSYRRSLSTIYFTCGLDWADLKAAIPSVHLLDADGRFDVDGLIRRLDVAAVNHPARLDARSDATMTELLRRVRRGDLSPLVLDKDRSAPVNSDPAIFYRDLLETSVSARD